MERTQLALGAHKTWRKEVLFLLLCVVVGAFLRVYTFDRKSLWMDEIYTYQDSQDGLMGQLKFYKQEPNSLHPPLFFLLTHAFYPFPKPERDLRVIPVVFGILSILMIYFFARRFSSRIAIPCALSLALMTYHISLSQDARAYTLSMFTGMLALYFLLRHLETSRKRYLPFVAFCFAVLFYTSYTSIPFMLFSQLLWFYQTREGQPKPSVRSFLLLNALVLLLCLPWVVFILTSFKGGELIGYHKESAGPFWTMMYGILHDWAPYLPLLLVSVAVLCVFPFVSRDRRNACVLLATLVCPVLLISLACRVFHLTHFFSSRYFVDFLPLFLVSLYLSVDDLQERIKKRVSVVRIDALFLILFLCSNLLMLPFYYQSEKQDFRGLVNYMKPLLRDGDRIFDGHGVSVPAMLHYFGVRPAGRYYVVTFSKNKPGEEEYRISFAYQKKNLTMYFSKVCCTQFLADRNRLWIVADKNLAEKIKADDLCPLVGYFDGSFLNLMRFPTNASMYLFLWDPSSPGGKGIDMKLE